MMTALELANSIERIPTAAGTNALIWSERVALATGWKHIPGESLPWIAPNNQARAAEHLGSPLTRYADAFDLIERNNHWPRGGAQVKDIEGIDGNYRIILDRDKRLEPVYFFCELVINQESELTFKGGAVTRPAAITVAALRMYANYSAQLKIRF